MRKRVVVGLVVLAIVAAGAGWIVWDRRGSGDGPLIAGTPSGYGQAIDVGRAFTVGHVLLGNEGTEPAVVERVRLLGATGPLEMLGVRARRVPDEHGGGMALADFGFPPERYPDTKPLSELNVVPVSGTRTPAGDPEERLELMIGVRITGPGIAGSRAVEVTYRVGKRRYVEVFGNTIYLCAPKEEHWADCPPEDGEFDFDDRVLE